MSVEPPDPGRPTGPPSGPLSGSSQPPPPGPPAPPPGGDGGAGPPGPQRRPWWKSVPGIAAIAAAVAAAVILAVVFTRSGGGGTPAGGGGEVFLQAADAPGRDPFTESTARDSTAPTSTPSPATEPASPNELRGVNGDQPGLYGGTRDVAACDVEQQIRYLQEVPAKNEAFASVLDLDPADVPGHLRALTPLQLRMDTRVTNHGYRDGAAYAYQAVLQAGTAVLVDDRGVPQVRCACGNPLTDPVEQSSPRYVGDRWPGYDPARLVVIVPAPKPIKEFKVYDPEDGTWFERDRGDTGGKDRPTEPPGKPTPSDSASPSRSASPGDSSKCPPGDPSPCSPTSQPPSSTPPDSPSEAPSSSEAPPPPPEPEPDSSPQPDTSDAEPVSPDGSS